MAGLLLNCDLGENETSEQTARLLALVDAASICCGVHAGSPDKTRETLHMAKQSGVMVGAHPGLATAGGRGAAVPSPSVFRELLETQLFFFMASARVVGVPVCYVKLHGALYHAVESDDALAEVYLDCLSALAVEGLGIFTLSGGRCARLARARGVRVWEEIFADRGYESNGRLVARGEAGALLGVSDAEIRMRRWCATGQMQAVDGSMVSMAGDTVCVHSDSDGAVFMLHALRACVRD